MALSNIHQFAVTHSMKLNSAKCKEMLIKAPLHYAQFLVGYGTDKIGTRTTFLVLGLPIQVIQEPKSGTVPKMERSVNGA
jgi:hypothetical protein